MNVRTAIATAMLGLTLAAAGVAYAQTHDDCCCCAERADCDCCDHGEHDHAASDAQE